MAAANIQDDERPSSLGRHSHHTPAPAADRNQLPPTSRLEQTDQKSRTTGATGTIGTTPSPERKFRSSRLNRASGKFEAQQVKLRARHLTFSLFMFVGAISSLAPFLTLHLTNRVGFLLFESDLLQLRSSLITNVVCLSTLVILGLIIVIITRTLRLFQEVNNSPSDAGESQQNLNRRVDKRRNLLLQKVLKRSAGSLAILSILAYLSLALIVPHIHQTQRLPYATFDCNANLIIIENCQQQFATHRPSGATSSGDNLASQESAATLFDILQQLIGGDLNGNNGRLANKLECLKYDEESLERSRVPTRFLLNKCGLVCEPHRQQLHQFGDDLNPDLPPRSNSDHRPLVAPYSQQDFLDANNGTRETVEEFGSQNERNDDMVSLKLCFSGEIDGANSNYKRFCIENLTSGDRSAASSAALSSGAHRNHQPQFHPDQTLTVGQLNAILSRVRIDQTAAAAAAAVENGKQPPVISSQPASTLQAAELLPSNANAAATTPLSSRIDQSTHYVNPIVQFESHFKNWPHLSRISTNDQQSTFFNERPFETGELNDSKRSWCKFKPIPPFIVNNKPFSDIHCSLEHDYLMSTGGPQAQRAAAAAIDHDQPLFQHRRRRRRRQPGAMPKIYLKKSTLPMSGNGESFLSHNERCNIQCKVNILYQALARTGASTSKRRGGLSMGGGSPIDSYYLPMKYCLIVSGDGDKSRSSNYYLVFRSIADASLLLAFILIDLQLLIESKDTKQFQLGDKRVRLLGLLLAITLPPLLVGILFDLAASWMPNYSHATTSGPRSYREGYLIQWLNERAIPLMSETLERLGVQMGLVAPVGGNRHSGRVVALNSSEFASEPFAASTGGARHRQELVVDNYLIPFIIYAMLMFAFAVSTFKLPLVSLASPLVEISSTEELGLVGSTSSSREDVSSRLTVRQPASHSSDSHKRKQAEAGATSVKEALKGKISSLRRSLSPARSAAPAENVHPQAPNGNSQQSAQNLVAFALLALFMGLQFNLSQITQTQILLESFNIQNNLMQQQQQQQLLSQSSHLQERPNKVAIWFVLVSNSSGALVLLLAILFGNELSLFLNEFYPFKTLPKVESALSRRQNLAQFYKFLALALVVYALRYFVLANMAAQASKMKWFLVVLFQSTELLNFPLAWFVLTLRAHELLLEYGQLQREDAASELGHNSLKSLYEELPPERTLKLHLVIQTALAFVYFALARFLALFTHSFHASLYLHSDDIDWFVESFYDRKTASDRMATNRTAPPESLFLPLPSERQTYVHASRSFVKYNSVVCLLFGIILSSLFLFHKYQIYLEQRRLDRALKRARTPHSDCESELIDERLSQDLAQIHAKPAKDSRGQLGKFDTDGQALTQHIPRTTKDQLRRHEEQLATETANGTGPMSRAKVHFRYGFGQRRDSSSSSAGSYSLEAAAEQQQQQQQQQHQLPRASGPERGDVEAWRRVPQADRQFRMSRLRDIPVIVEEERQQREQQAAPESRAPDERHTEVEELEQITLTRSKRIQMVADDEDWSLGDGRADDESDATSDAQHTRDDRNISPEEAQTMLELSMAISPPPPEFADDFEQMMPPPAGFASSRDDVRLGEAQHSRTQSGARQCVDAPGHSTGQQRKRQITFAPLTTFIDQDGAHSTEHYGGVFGRHAQRLSNDDVRQFNRELDSSHNNRRAASTIERRHPQTQQLMASPEPSIDDDDDDE